MPLIPSDDIEVEVVALGEWPSRVCGICGDGDSEYMGIARDGRDYGAMGVCKSCFSRVHLILNHKFSGEPN